MDHRFIPNLTEEQIADIQLEGLKWTAQHTCANSPFYRARFKETGVEPGDIGARRRSRLRRGRVDRVTPGGAHPTRGEHADRAGLDPRH